MQEILISTAENFPPLQRVDFFPRSRRKIRAALSAESSQQRARLRVETRHDGRRPGSVSAAPVATPSQEGAQGFMKM